MRRPHLFRVLVVTVVTTLVQLCSSLAINHANCLAQTASAQIQGHESIASNTGTSVCEWLGIPYATPPVGQLRFAPPVKSQLEGPFEASSWGFDCPQNTASVFAYPNATPQYQRIYGSFVNQLNNTQSEDCLTLNIWSRGGQSSSRSSSSSTSKAQRLKLKLKPVIVWIHGGRFSAGSSHTPFYHGANLASSSSRDVVVVTFNFRINIFGFPGSPETTDANLGFLDQYRAVEWVYENIGAFGGDRARITLVGQSSGAVAVSNWAFAFQNKKPLVVARTMAHSGSLFSFPFLSKKTAASNWDHVAASLGCGASSSSSSSSALACMRSPNISFQAILAAVRTVPPVPGTSTTRSIPAFQATVDNITAFSVSDYVSRLKTGAFAKEIPHVLIHNHHESGFYRISALAQTHNNTTLPEREWLDFEQESFTCAVAAEAYWRAMHNDGAAQTTYRARYMADWANLRLYENPASGAYHGVEINMITGNSALVSGIPDRVDEERLSRVMQAAWTDFAAGLGLGWPRYNASGETLIRLGLMGNTNSTKVAGVDVGVDVVSSTMYDGACPGLGLEFWDEAIPS
ncbi:alpha/beta-hydrolase [Xylariaceae sp. FL0594]|nr:alpha/beta-hydrolase [Xylariaceae sp. FL0594]